MKIIKNLLPVAIVGAAASVATPLVVSCGNNKVTMVDITKFDDSKVKTLEGEVSVRSSKSSEFYGNAVKEDSSILMNDFYCAEKIYLDLLTSQYPEYKVTTKKYLAGISDKVGFDTLEFWNQGIHHYYPAFTFLYNWDVEIEIEDEANNTVYTISSKHETSFYKFPVICYWNWDGYAGPTWYLSSLSADADEAYALGFIREWSMDANIDYSMKKTWYDDQGEVYDELVDESKANYHFQYLYQFEAIYDEIYKQCHGDEEMTYILYRLSTGCFSFPSKSMEEVEPLNE